MKVAHNEGIATTTNSVETVLCNIEGLIEEARENLDKIVAAHVLVVGELALGVECPFDRSRMRVVAESAAHVSLDLDGLQRHVAEIRDVIVGEGADDTEDTLAAAEE